MKKYFILMFAMSASFVAVAAEYTAKATLKITSGDGYFKSLYLTEREGSTVTGVLNEQTTPIIALYAMYDEKRCETLGMESLGNRAIGFKATQSLTYTITCTAASGNALYIKQGANDPIQISTSMEAIQITITDAQKGTFIDDALALYVEEPYTRTVTADSWGTICLPWATPNKTSLEGATFYEALGTKNEQGIALAEVDSLEAGKPYVFHATATEIKVTYDAATEVDDTIPTNHVTGSFAGCAVPAGQYLIVDNLLYKAEGTGNSIDANRAYFDVAKMGAYQPSQAPGRKVVFFGGKTTPTALEAAEAPAMKDGKMMIDGQLIIIKGGKMFNAQGAAL